MNKQDLLLSVIIPVYNEEESLPELYDWICRVVDHHRIETEILFIDDGSTDSSWKVIQQFNANDPRVKGHRFNRNYGKSAALQVGFELAKGSVVITMDADLQDSPDEIPALIGMIRDDGYDLVSGWKKKRHDPISKTIPSKFFNYVTRIVSGIKLHDFNCGLKAYKTEVVKSLDVYGEMHRYIPLLAKWNGYKNIGEKNVEHRARRYGVTKFGMRRFVTGFLDLLSVTFVTRFRKKPMHLFGTFGIVFFLMGSAIALWLIGEKIYKSSAGIPVREVVDQPLFFLSLLTIIIGTQLFLSGFVAEMIIQVGAKKDDYRLLDSTEKNA